MTVAAAPEACSHPDVPTKFGQLVLRLRRERGLTRDTLADASNVHERTLAALEQELTRSVRPGTARAIYEALAADQPLSPDDLSEFNRLSGLKMVAPTAPIISPRRAVSMEATLETLHRAVDAVGLATIQKVLEAIAESELDGRTVRVKHPPVQRDFGGVKAVEETTSEYRLRPDAPPAQRRERRPG